MTDNDNTRALMATIDRLVGERDHLLDEVERVGKIADAVVASVVASERMERDELREIVAMLTSRCDAAERRESELGLQVVAQAARLRLADDLAKASRNVLNEVLAVIADDAGHDEPWFICPHGELFDAVAAWDAVPGDVPLKGTPFDEAGTMNPDKVTP